jgi:hypothetical protein
MTIDQLGSEMIGVVPDLAAYVGGGTEKDSIAVVEVMVKEIDGDYWHALRRRLERELSQDEIVIRAQQIRRL